MESKFTGRLIGLIGRSICAYLLTLVTFGIAAPWALCIVQRWYINNTVVDGRRLRFDGTGGQLFGKYLLWMLLCIVTCGIYSFWLVIKMQQWITSHTHMEPAEA